MKKELNKSSTLKKLLPFFKPHLGRLSIAMISMLIVTGVHLARPMILRAIIDVAIPNKDVEYAIKAALIFIVCLLVGAAAMYVRIRIMAKIGAEVVAEIKKKVFRHVLTQGMKFFDLNKTGTLITRTESDATQLKSLFTQSTAQLFSSSLLMVGTIAVLYHEDPTVGVFTVVSTLIVMFFMYFYMKYIRGLYVKTREKNSILTGYLAEYIQGVPLIKVYGRENDILDNMKALNKEKAELDIKAMFVSTALFSSAFKFLSEVGAIAAIFAYGSSKVFDGTMTVGTLVMYIELIRQFFRPLDYLIEVLAQLQSGLAAGGRVFGVLETNTTVPDKGEDDEKLELKNQIEFDNVTFSYDKDIVLKNVNFKIEKGKQVAIVGASGSGKTTCVSLLLRFYDPVSGQIKIDGRDISSISLHDWRRKIALVLQEIYLFPGTIMENLKSFHEGISDEVVILAAKRLGAHEFISSQPNGYDTKLAERGANLSFGERQLLSYVRAMVRNPDLLILDEATSSVDVITERKLQASMLNLMEGRTSLIIAHRLSTIKQADSILVFEKGELLQQGNHDELMAEDGVYKELVKMQSAGHTPDSAKVVA